MALAGSESALRRLADHYLLLTRRTLSKFEQNVLWDELTVEEHVRIFNRLKFTETRDTKRQIHDLITACDLDRKLKAKSKTLSGGQKRKLQLGMMFTGGSRVCAVDEISSGLDPLSRRKIWDILLAERGARTIILTTHFLDEADLLSDHIAILSKGTLKVEGSAVELKHKLGGGYRVHIYNVPSAGSPPHFEGIPRKQLYDQTIYSIPNSAEAARFISRLEEQGIRDYQVNGPTIEDVFLKVAEEVRPERANIQSQPTENPQPGEGPLSALDEKSSGVDVEDKGLELLTGKRIGMASQARVLFRKRLTILRRNYLPYCAAFLIPVIAAGLVTLFLKGFKGAGCSANDQISIGDISNLLTQVDFELVIGPPSKLDLQALRRFQSTLPGGGGSGSTGSTGSALTTAIHYVNTLGEFNQYVERRYANITPGGFFLGENGSPPTFAYRGNAGIQFATITQNALDNLLTNVSISSQYQSFDTPIPDSAGNTLQLIVYFGLAMAVYPAFFALYPTVERLRNVRTLHYSNGVRSLPLWLSYVFFDFLIVVATSILSVVIFRAVTNVWYHLEYLFVVFFLYGLAATLLSYVISLFAKSQLAAFAFAAGGQA